MREHFDAFLIGERGMLGHVVKRYFEERSLRVETSTSRYSAKHDDALVKAAAESSAKHVINCIGKVRQANASDADMFAANTLLPLHLSRILRPDQRLVQVSSDCVFSGHRETPIDLHSSADPTDVYGLSKALAEIVAKDYKTCLLRTSIIGPEVGTSRGLFSWFVNSQAGKLLGYTNHLWNGVTTLELAKVIYDVCSRDSRHLVQVTSECTVSKCELLEKINVTWNLGKVVVPTEHSDAVDHTLRGCRGYVRKSIDEQLAELKRWY